LATTKTLFSLELKRMPVGCSRVQLISIIFGAIGSTLVG